MSVFGQKLWTACTDGCDLPKGQAAALPSQVYFKSSENSKSSENPKQVFFKSSENSKQVFFKFISSFFQVSESNKTTSIQVPGKFQTTLPEGTKQASMDRKFKILSTF